MKAVEFLEKITKYEGKMKGIDTLIDDAAQAGIDIKDIKKLIKYLEPKVDDRGVLDYIKNNHKSIMTKMGESSLNDMGQIPKGTLAVIENLGDNKFSKDNDSQKEMVEQLGKLAESDCEYADKFMGGVDEACSKIKESMCKKKESMEEAVDANFLAKDILATNREYGKDYIEQLLDDGIIEDTAKFKKAVDQALKDAKVAFEKSLKKAKVLK